MPLLVVDRIECCNLQAASFPNSTGIGFLDHMLDQFLSHAQVGVGIHVIDSDNNSNDNETGPSSNHENYDNESLASKVQHHNRFATSTDAPQQQQQQQQELLMIQVGTALGKALRPLLLDNRVPPDQVSRFCCPLDEALVECILQTRPKGQDNATTPPLKFSYNVAPYGIHPSTTSGRSHIGYMETQPLELFWQNFATHAGLAHFQLRKIRGDNAHHIVESSFKATARALRNLLDHVHDVSVTPTLMATDIWIQPQPNLMITHVTTNSLSYHHFWSSDSDHYQASAALQRRAQTERKTKETNIMVQLHLTPPINNYDDDNDDDNHNQNVHTGIAVLDQFLFILARAAQMSLTCTCQGDVWVDEHHTSEDVAISLGQVLYEALGTKAGLNRMWCASAQCREAVVEVTMDLSNRPCLRHNLTLTEEEYVVDPRNAPPSNGNTSAPFAPPRLTVEMFEHVLDSLVVNGRMTVHIVELNKGANVWERAMATAQAFGTALRYCSMVDCRRAGQTASSKGTLSV